MPANARGNSRRGLLHIHWAFPPTTGGVESHLFDLTHHQAALGWRVTILTGEENAVRSPAYEVVSSPALNLAQIRSSRLPLGEQVSAFAAELDAPTSAREVEVVHCHNRHHFPPPPALASSPCAQSTPSKSTTPFMRLGLTS